MATASDERRPADREPDVSEETRQALEDGRVAVERLMKALAVEIDRLAEDGTALWSDGKRELQEALEALRERFSEPSPPEPSEPQSI